MNVRRIEDLSKLLSTGGPAHVLQNREKSHIPRVRLLHLIKRLV